MSDLGPGLGSRREAREEALALLYEAELTGEPAPTTIGSRPVPPEPYTIEMVSGVAADQAEIDALLDRNLDRWRVARLAIVDRVLARMSTWELLRRPDVPTGVVLSEAVELATQYSGEESPRFLNGVLRAVADEVRPDEAGSEPR